MEALDMNCLGEILRRVVNPRLLFVSAKFNDTCDSNLMYKSWLELHVGKSLGHLISTEWKGVFIYFYCGSSSYSRYYHHDISGQLPNNSLIVNVWLHTTTDPPNVFNKYLLEALHNNIDTVITLLGDSRVDPTIDHNYLIKRAASIGNLQLVNCLLDDPRVDPSACINDPIRSACRLGHINVVRRLLLNPRVDPSTVNNQAIQRAALNGYLEVVEELLKDRRVDPSDCNNLALSNAKINGHTDIVLRLLADSRVSSK